MRGLIARIPGKLSGAYHIRGTRLSVRCVKGAAKHAREYRRRGFSISVVRYVKSLYPQLTRAQIYTAIRFRAPKAGAR